MVIEDLIVDFRDIEIAEFENLLLLDRDGVVLQNIYRNNLISSARNLGEMAYSKNIVESLNKINFEKIAIVIVTNQPEVSRATISIEEMKEMNQKLLNDLPISGIICCPHTSSYNCPCRKPNPYMLEKAIEMIKPKNKKILMVGDRDSDLRAGIAINIDIIHIAEQCELNCPAKKHYSELYEGTEFIIEYYKNR